MDTPEEVQIHIHTLHEAVWELAAIAVALRDPAGTDPDQRRAAELVLVQARLMAASAGGVVPAPGLSELGNRGSGLAAQAGTALLQSPAALSGGVGRELRNQRG